MLHETNKNHPAAEWALGTHFTPMHVDCTITVALKILDHKCKMLPGEISAVLAIYDVVKQLPGELFCQSDQDVIATARCTETASGEVMEKIHTLRLYAENNIPKAVMKEYKAILRDGLFG
jgi:hypothetical protein